MEKKKESRIKIFFEDEIEEGTKVFYHPVLPIFCTVSNNSIMKIVNFESGKCISLFELFSGFGCISDEMRIPKSFICIDAIFADKEAVMWNSGMTGVANGLIIQHNLSMTENYLLLLDRHCIVRWEYMTERWAVVDVVREGKFGATKAALYDRENLVIGYEDGAVGIFNYMSLHVKEVLQGGHKTPVTHFLILSSNVVSRPLLVSSEKEGQVCCWNLESQSIVFRLSEMVKSRIVRYCDKLIVDC